MTSSMERESRHHNRDGERHVRTRRTHNECVRHRVWKRADHVRECPQDVSLQSCVQDNQAWEICPLESFCLFGGNIFQIFCSRAIVQSFVSLKLKNCVYRCIMECSLVHLLEGRMPSHDPIPWILHFPAASSRLTSALQRY